MARTFDQLPYAPGGEGRLGHMGEFTKNRMPMLELLAKSPTPIMRLKTPFPGVRVGCVNSPDTVEQVLVQQARAFHKSDMLRVSLYPLAGEGLFSSNGDLWRKQRKLMAPIFTPKSVADYADDMVECALRTIRGWRDGSEMSLLDETTRLTMAVAGKTLFRADTFSEADDIGKALTTALGWTGTFMGRPVAVAQVMGLRRIIALEGRIPSRLEPLRVRAQARFQTPFARVLPGGRDLKRAVRLLDDYIQRLIDDRRRSDPAVADLLDRLLHAKDEQGRAMSDRQLRDEVVTLFIAGHETTATSLAWTIWLLGRNPEIRAQVEEEVDGLTGDPTVNDLPKLDLTLRVFKEALRIYPPVYAFGRDAIAPVAIDGWELPFRTNIFSSPFAIHRNPDFWSEPERFDPDRFLPARSSGRHRYAFLPFGAGPRFCIGNHFAYLEAQIALAVLLRRYRFEVLSNDKPVLSATMRPSDGVRVVVRKR